MPGICILALFEQQSKKLIFLFFDKSEVMAANDTNTTDDCRILSREFLDLTEDQKDILFVPSDIPSDGVEVGICNPRLCSRITDPYTQKQRMTSSP